MRSIGGWTHVRCERRVVDRNGSLSALDEQAHTVAFRRVPRERGASNRYRSASTPTDVGATSLLDGVIIGERRVGDGDIDEFVSVVAEDVDPAAALASRVSCHRRAGDADVALAHDEERAPGQTCVIIGEG